MHPRRTFLSFVGLGSQTAAPLLYSYLREHPASCLTNEPTRFFSSTEVFAKGIDWYEAQFPEAKSGMLRGELAYDYLSHAPTAGLLARTYPNAKLVVVIENPLVSVRVEYVEALRARTITRQLSLTEFLRNHPEVLARARYGRQLVPYFSYYSPTDLLVWLAADIREDPLRAVQKTYEHLGLPTEFVPLTLRHLVVEEVDEKKKPGFIKRRIMAIRALIRAGYGYLMKYLKPKPPQTETVAEIARRLPLTPELETKLKEYFHDDVRQLSDLLHRNLLVEWGFEEAV